MKLHRHPISLAIALLPTLAAALPQGAQVVQGQVSVTNPNAQQLNLSQSSDRAIINWTSFSIGANERVSIQQPGANSVLLNRVTGVDASLILGRLDANGQVFVLNPRGIVLGKGSTVDAGSFVASTLGMSDSAFMADRYELAAGPVAGRLVAAGEIKADTVALAAPQIEATGTIEARRVGLAAASHVKVDVEGDGLILFDVRNDAGLDTRLDALGRIDAGQSAELRAQARAGMADTVLNLDGIVRARGFSKADGRIVVDGGSSGITQITGQLDAPDIAVRGEKVGLLGAALLDASGPQAGRISVGGEWQGQGGGLNSQWVYVAPTATLKADATAPGQGGQVVLWSEQRTDFYGLISAQGAGGGSGGAIETSSRGLLNAPTGQVRLGTGGHWLLDPSDITINDAGPDSNISGASPFTNSPGNANAVLSTNTLNTALAGGATITVQTSSGGGGNGTITVAGTVVATSSANLVLSANGAINFTSGSVDTKGGNLTLNAGTGVSIDAASSVNTGAGAFGITAGAAVQLGTSTANTLSVSTTAGGISQVGALNLASTASLTATGQPIALSNASNSFGGSVSATGSSVNLRSSGALTVASLTQTGAVTLQAGGLLTLPASNINTGAAALSLSSGSTLTTAGTLSGGAVSLSAAGNLSLNHAVTASGTLGLTASGGNISQNTAFSAGGAATINAGATGNLSLGSANTFSGSVALTGNQVTVNAGSTLQIGALTLSGNAALNLSATNALSLPATAINVGANDVTLGSSSGSLTTAAAISGQNLSLSAGTTLALGGSLNAAGTLGLSGNTAITQSAGQISASSTSSITGGAVTLGQAANSFTGAVALTGASTQIQATGALGFSSLSLTAGSNLDLHSTGALSLPAGNLLLGSGNLSLQQDAGSFTTQGKLGGANISLNAAGLSLGHDVTASGNLSLTSSAGIKQTAGTVSATGTSTIAAGSTAVDLSQSGNSFGGAIALTAGTTSLRGSGSLGFSSLSVASGSDLTLRAGGSLSLAASDVLLGTGNLSLRADGGAFTSSGRLGGSNVTLNAAGINLGHDLATTGALSLTSSAAISQTAGAITVSGTTGIAAGTASVDLQQSGNGFTGAVSVTAGSTQLRSSAALSIASLSLAAGSSLGLRAGGLLSLPAGDLLLGSGNLSLQQDVGAFSTTGKLSAANLALNAASLSLGDNLTASGTLSLTSTAGPIAQTAGAISVSGTSTINAGSSAVTLNRSGNSFGGLIDLTGGSSNLRSSGALGFSSLVLAANSDLTLRGNTLSLPAGALALGSGNLSLQVDSGSLATGADISGNNLSLTANGISLGHNLTASGALTLDAGSGAINQTAGALAITGTSQFTATGAVTANQAGNSFGGNVSVSGGSTDLRASGGLTLASLSLAANSDLGLRAGGILSLPGGPINLGSGNLSLRQDGGAFSTAAAITAANVSLTSGGDLGLAHNLTATGNLSLTSTAGQILQSGGSTTVSGTTSANAGANPVSLARSGNNFSGAVSVTGGAVTLQDSNALVLGTINAASLDITSGALSQNAAATVSGATTLNTGSAAIVLANPGNRFTGGLAVTGGDVTLRDSADLTLTSLTQAANTTLSLTAGNALVLPAFSYTRGSGDLTLSAGTGSFTSTSAISGHNINLSLPGGVSLGHDLTASGTLTLATSNQAITQTAGVIQVTGTSSIQAGSGDVTLGNASNSFGGSVALAGGTLLMRAAGNLSFSSLAGTPNHAVTLQADNNLTLPAGNLDTGTADLSLQAINGALIANGNLTGQNLTLTAGLGLTLASDLTIPGNLSLTSGTGGIVQTAGKVQVTGTTTLNSGSGALTLASSTNDFIGTVSATGAAITLRDANDLTLTTLAPGANQNLSLTAGGTLTIPAGNLSTGTGDLSLSAGNVLATTGTLAGRNIALTGSGGLDLGHNISASGTLALTAGGTGINQSAGQLAVTGTSSIQAGSTVVNLANPLNSFGGAVALAGGQLTLKAAGNLSFSSLTGTPNQSVSLLAGHDLSLPAGNLDTGSADLSLVAQTGTLSVGGQLHGQNLTLSAGAGLTLADDLVIPGTLSLSSGGTGINQTGGKLQITGTTTINAGSSSVNLNQAANDFVGNLAVTGGAITIQDSNALGFSSISQAANQALTLTAGGVLTLPAGPLSTGTADLSLTSTGAGLSLPGALSGRNLSLSAAGSFSLNQNLTASGTLSLANSAGNIIQSGGAINVTGTSSLTASGALQIDGASNHFTGAVTANAQSVSLHSLGNLVIASVTAQANQPVSLQAGGSLTLPAGAIDTGSADLSLVASGANLTMPGALGGQNVTLTAGQALSLGNNLVARGSLHLSAGNGITQTAGTVNAQSTSTINAGSSAIQLDKTGNVWTGAIALTGGATTLKGTGNVTLSSLSLAPNQPLWLEASGALALPAGSINTGTADLTLKALGGSLTPAGSLAGRNLLLNASGAISFGSDVTASGTLVLTGSSAIQTGGSMRVGGTAQITTTGGDITLQGANSDFGGAVTLSGGNAKLSDTNSLLLASAHVGNLTLNAHGAITQQSGLQVSGTSDLNAGGGAITLDRADNQFSGVITLGGGSIKLVNSLGTSLAGLNVGDLDVSSGGALAFAGGSIAGGLKTQGGSISQSGALSVGGSSSLGGSGMLDLSNAGNHFGGDVLLTGSFGDAKIGNSGALHFGGNAGTISLQASGLMTLLGSQASQFNAVTGAGINQTGALVLSSGLKLTADTAQNQNVDLSGAGNKLIAVELAEQNGGSYGAIKLASNSGLKLSGVARTIDLSAQGPLEIGGGKFENLLLNSSGPDAAILQSGAVQVSGQTTLSAGSGAITLDLAGNSFKLVSLPQAGNVRLKADGGFTLGSSSVSQQLWLSSPGTIQLDGPLSGSGRLVLAGSGDTLINSSQSYGGGTELQAGRLLLSGASNPLGTGAVLLAAGTTLQLDNGSSLGNAITSQGATLANRSGSASLSGPLTLAADTVFDLTNALTVSGAIDGAGGLQLIGGGSLTLAHANSFSGALDVQAGRLVASAAGALPDGSRLQLATGTELDLSQAQTLGGLSGNGLIQLQGADLTLRLDQDTAFGGRITGSGGLIKSGAAQLLLSGASDYLGATRVSAGSLALSGQLSDQTAMDLGAGTRFNLLADASLGSLAGSGTVNLGGHSLRTGSNQASTAFAGSLLGSGQVSKLGSGSWTLSGPNSYSGAFTLSAGSLVLAGAQSLSETQALSLASGTQTTLGADLHVGSLAGSGALALGGHSLTSGANGQDTRFDGAITGNGDLSKAGTGVLTLGGTNAFSGTLALQAGGLTLASDAALGIGNRLQMSAGTQLRVQGEIRVASLEGDGQILLDGHRLSAGDERATSFAGSLAGSGGFTKLGNGELTLSGTNSSSGGLQIQAGSLRLAGADTTLGTGPVQNQGRLVLDRAGAWTLAPAISGSGSLELRQGEVLLSGANSYTGATLVSGGKLSTSGDDRLAAQTAVTVARAGSLVLGGKQSLASLDADGNVRLAGSLTTTGDQRYGGTLTLDGSLTLSGKAISASNTGNQLGSGTLSVNATSLQLVAPQDLSLGTLNLAQGGSITTPRLVLLGDLKLAAGTLALLATAAPDDAKATAEGRAQVAGTGLPLAFAQSTVTQSGGSVQVASGAQLDIRSLGSISLTQAGNSIEGGLSALVGPAFGTAWQAHTTGGQAIVGQINLAGSRLNISGAGLEADVIRIKADQLATSGTALIAARMPYDEQLLGTSLSLPALTLELTPKAFSTADSYGSAVNAIHVLVGSKELGGRTGGLDAGYLTVLPKGGAQGATAVFLSGPISVGKGGYRFFSDGAGRSTEIPVSYNGSLLLTPQALGALSSINGDAEDARRLRFQETVRTENVTLRLRSGVIAEVGPGRPATSGTQGSRLPESCTPTATLTCQ